MSQIKKKQFDCLEEGELSPNLLHYMMMKEHQTSYCKLTMWITRFISGFSGFANTPLGTWNGEFWHWPWESWEANIMDLFHLPFISCLLRMANSSGRRWSLNSRIQEQHLWPWQSPITWPRPWQEMRPKKMKAQQGWYKISGSINYKYSKKSLSLHFQKSLAACRM